MKNKRFLLYFLFLIISIFAITSISISASAKFTDIEECSEQTSAFSQCTLAEGSYNINFENENKHFLQNENIVVSYLVSDDISISTLTYTQTGFNVISAYIDENNDSRLILTLSCIPNSDEYNITLPITLENESILTASLYAIKNEYGISIRII